MEAGPLFFTYMISGMERKESVPDLGVLMHLKLLLPQNIESVDSNAIRNVSLIKWIGRHSRMIFFIMLYKSLENNTLEYASVIWNSNCD